MTPPFELWLFSTDTRLIQAAVQAGVKGIVVDWERLGKAERQAGYDTQIGQDSYEDLVRVRAATTAPVMCRINPFGPATKWELEAAIQAGADEVLLPMVRSVDEVERVLTWAGGRVGVAILVETLQAVRLRYELGRLPVSRVYLGLHDLAIERGAPNPFRAVTDGIVELVRAAFAVPFGFAGVTLPDRGFPIPCRLIIYEFARLNCQFTFMRRSFLRDIKGHDVSRGVRRILEAIEQALRAPNSELEAARQALLMAIEMAEPFFRERNGRIVGGS